MADFGGSGITEELFDWIVANVPQGSTMLECILVDGPTGEGNRWGFLENLDLFRQDVPIIVDDTWRRAEKDLLLEVAKKLVKNISCSKTLVLYTGKHSAPISIS